MKILILHGPNTNLLGLWSLQNKDNTTLDKEQCLLDQNFIKDEKKSVAEYMQTYGNVKVTSFKRVALG